MDDHYDVIIIGTGAGGGTLAHRLAPTGKRILLLERGGYLPREPENWDTREVFGRARYVTDERWVDKDGTPFQPHAQYYVGGNTKFYGAILFRLREQDFGEVRHHAGISPAWPISYADLEPYYAEAERLYLVHGQAGEDPTEPPRSGPFPHPAVSHEPRIQQLHDDRSRGRPLRALREVRRLPLPRRRQGRRPRALRAAGAPPPRRHAQDQPQGRAPGDERQRP
jgi:choline dehydrogenase-like flavoprotein